MERLLDLAFRSVALRLVVAGVIVISSAVVTSSWLGAAYQRVMWNTSFASSLLSMSLSAALASVVGGFIIVYPLERWVIGSRAGRLWRWVAVRVLVYGLAGLPTGLVIRLGMRLGNRSYPAIVESFYFVSAVINGGVIGVVYSLFERALGEVQRREARLRAQIQQLRIEIDQVRREQKVREIAESDYFRELQTKAREMRER